jgi:hypothetical protein
MAEVGDDHKSASGNAKHFGEQSAGVADLLQGLAEHCEVKAVAGNVGQPLVEVGLNCGQTTLNDTQQVFLLELHSKHVAVEFQMQSLNQPAIPAAQVNYPAAARDVLHDEFVSEADGGIRDLVAGAL